MFFRVSLIVLLCVLDLNDAYRILVVFPIPGKSHSILGDGFVDTLAEAGHEVTVITPFVKEKVAAKVRQVDASSVMDLIPSNIVRSMSEQARSTLPLYLMALMSAGVSRATVIDQRVQALLRDRTQQFDLVIAEWVFTDLLSGFSAVYECPLIWMSPMDPNAQALELIDELSHPAYSGNMISKAVPPFTFTERVSELMTQFYIKGLTFLLYVFFEKPYYNEVFGPILEEQGRSLPPLREVAHNASMVFFNAHPVLGAPFRMPQTGKYIGGYHIDPNTKPLPENLKKLFDKAQHGVIYFSMGSSLKSKDIPPAIMRALVDMFGTLKQTVLWKFEEDLHDLPNNLHIVKWAPQASVLSHSNVRMFITQGGKLSTTETIYYGVPVIGIPIFGDQFANMIMAVDKGYGMQVLFGDDLADRLAVAIHEMLTNSSYTIKAKELSSTFHDLPVTPRQELTHWVEHVVRTGGAPHLRSPALMVPWYQKMYLDLAALVLVILYAGCKVCKLVCNKKKSVSSTKKND